MMIMCLCKPSITKGTPPCKWSISLCTSYCRWLMIVKMIIVIIIYFDFVDLDNFSPGAFQSIAMYIQYFPSSLVCTTTILIPAMTVTSMKCPDRLSVQTFRVASWWSSGRAVTADRSRTWPMVLTPSSTLRLARCASAPTSPTGSPNPLQLLIGLLK